MLLSLLLRYFFDDLGHFGTEASLVKAANPHAPGNLVRRRVATGMSRRLPPCALIRTVHLNLASTSAVWVLKHHLICRLCPCGGSRDLQGPAAR